MSKDKKPIGQQPKWEAFTNKLEEVLNQEHPVGIAIVWSDQQVVDEVNDNLPENERIAYRTFQRYKAGEIKDEGTEALFVSCYKRALRIQASNILTKMASDIPGGWQKWAWIMERKFDEWNLRSKSVDETPDLKRLVFRVVGESEGEEDK
jgi:hypothetical protein